MGDGKQDRQETVLSLCLYPGCLQGLNCVETGVRAGLMEMLHYRPSPWPSQATVIGETDQGDFVVEEVVFHSTQETTVPAFVLVPKTAQKRGNSCGHLFSRPWWILPLGKGKVGLTAG